MTYLYRNVNRPDHPLASKNGIIQEHRVLLYDKIGPGSHPCHHCGVLVTWNPGARTRKGALIVDHLDGNSWNNDLDNLVPSCQSCNIRRARDRRFMGKPYIIVNGRRSAATSRICAACGEGFLIETKAIRHAERIGKKNVGRYCSRGCMYSHCHK